MKQLRLVALVLCLFGVLGVTAFTQTAGEKEKAPAKAPATAGKQKAKPAKPPAKWEQLEPGVKVLKLYASEMGPDWPQIAMVQLNQAKHDEFEKDPLGFVNGHHIFPQNTRSVKPSGGPGMKKDQKKGGMADPWLMVFSHDITCDTLFSADSF